MGRATAVDSVNVNSTLHPPYFEMISDAILTLKDRSGSSQQAITKLIEEKYEKALPLNFKKTLSVQLKKFVKSERLIKVKNSFKISPAEKQKLAGGNDSRKKAVTGRKENEDKKNPETGGRKTKRLSQVKTPEGKNSSGKKKKKKAAVNVMGGKTKRLSQVKTPEGLKKKKKKGPTPTPTPMKRKISNMGKSPTGTGRDREAKTKRVRR